MEGPQILRYVVDASVVVKWFVPEEYFGSARQLKRSYEEGKVDIISPSLILFEVANALRYHTMVELSVEELAAAIMALRNMAITVEMSREIWTETFTLSKSEAITTYDAAYLSLALLNDARFVTADRELHDRLSDSLKQYVLLLPTIKKSPEIFV